MTVPSPGPDLPSNATPQTLPDRTVSWWVFGFGAATLILSLFVPLLPGGWAIVGHHPAKAFVFLLTAITVILAALAYSRNEYRRLYMMGLGLAFVGLALEYFVAALVVAAAVAAIFIFLGMIA